MGEGEVEIMGVAALGAATEYMDLCARYTIVRGQTGGLSRLWRIGIQYRERADFETSLCDLNLALCVVRCC